MKASLFITLLGLSALISACGGGDKPNIELIRDMMVSPAYKAQDERAGKSSMLVPPEGTLAIGKERYPYGKYDLAKAATGLKNPLARTQTAEVLARGKNRFEIYCGICHGQQGKGDGPIAEKMPVRPPSLLTDALKGQPDGYFYHVMYYGKGVMGSYSNQIHTADDRWAVVNYIRSLQKLAN